jgi:hypothetical protein
MRLAFVGCLIASVFLAGAEAVPDSIGVATMTPDGTISLQLRAEGKNGEIGDAVLNFQRGTAEYDDVLRHIGGIKPGETKSVPPWPDQDRRE